MAEVEYGSKDKCTGFKQPATGTTDFVCKINKSCDSCLRAKRRCDHKLPCGFSPSPATGLVGMKENAFLSDFFGALGFLPLTSESHIREIIIKMMACASGSVLKPGLRGKTETHQGGLTIRNAESSDRVTGPSACILWSAIALGALVKGAPPKEVNGYCRMATAEIHGFSPWPAEAVGARVILGYVYAFLGDQEEFSRYFKLAGALMGACKEHGYKEPFPIGLAEIIQSDKSMSEFDISMEDMRTLSAETISPPEMSSYPSDAEVYRYIIAYNRAFVQTYARLFLSAAEAPERDGDRSDDLGTTELPQNEGRLGMVSIRPDEVWKRLKDIPFDLDILEQAVTRRLLSVAAAGEFDRQGVFEKTKQVVVLAERYPGLFRFAPWSHVSHYLAELLARMTEPETRRLYDMVRKANNLVRNDSLPEIPPFEEWRGVSAICDNPACRMAEDYVEQLLAPTPYELSRGAMQEGFGDDDASSAEMLHHATGQTPGEEIRFTSHGEEVGIQDFGAVEVNSDIEIEMLSILANTEPDALEEALFSQTGSSDMEAFLVKPMERETIFPIDHGDGTGTDGEFLQAHLTYINAKMGQGVSYHPVRFDGIHGPDTAAEESVGAKDWLETINTIRDDTSMM